MSDTVVLMAVTDHVKMTIGYSHRAAVRQFDGVSMWAALAVDL
jgi:hypothetical protein